MVPWSILLPALGFRVFVWLDLSLDAYASALGFVGGCLPRQVEAGWALAPSVFNFSMGVMGLLLLGRRENERICLPWLGWI